jgi:hypothetical protein
MFEVGYITCRNGTSVTLPPKSAELRSTEEPVVHMVLYDGKAGDAKVPDGHDLVRLSLGEIPEGLESLELHIGAQLIHDVPAALLNPGEDVLAELGGGVLPLSKSRFMVARLALRFSRDFILSHEESSTTDEETDEVTLSDEEFEFVDSAYGVPQWGRRVHRRTVRTGKRVRRVTRGAAVVVPGVSFSTRSVALDSATASVDVLLTGRCDDATIADLKSQKRRVVVLHSSADGMRTVRVGNFLRFRENMAGLYYPPGDV